MFGGVGVDRGEDDKKDDMTELLPNIFAIEVPEGTAGISFRQSEFVNSTVSFYDQFTNKETLVELPGNCINLFTTKDCSNENARSLVKSHYSRSATLNTELGHYQSSSSRTTYMDYENGFCTMKTATESLHSLLKSKGLTAGNYLIIKKVEG